MKKALPLLCVLSLSLAANAQMITSTPDGELHSTVYGTSAKTYLLAQGGFGSFSDNDGYRTRIVVDGNDIYVHNIVREYPGIDSWVKGTVVEDGIVEFTFPQQVALDELTGSALYVNMMAASADGNSISLFPDKENPNLRMKWDGTKLTQIVPPCVENGTSAYAGMIGLTNGDGVFMSYAEQEVTYTIWNETLQVPAEGLTVTSYTAIYKNQWNEDFTALVKIATDGSTIWMNGLSRELPDSWVKGEITEDGSMSFASGQYLGIANDYFYFFYGASNEGIPVSKEYEWKDAAVFEATETGWKAADAIMINLGCTRPWFGNGIAGLVLTEMQKWDPIPANPEWGEPEWDDNDGMGVGDFFIPAVDVNGQALDTSNLYYSLYFNGELVDFGPDENGNPLTELEYGKAYDLILYEYGWYFVIFLEPLESIGVQSIYKTDGKEYLSDLVTYEFSGVGVDDVDADRSDVETTEYYNMAGVRIAQPEGLCIRRTVYADGTVKSVKLNARR